MKYKTKIDTVNVLSIIKGKESMVSFECSEAGEIEAEKEFARVLKKETDLAIDEIEVCIADGGYIDEGVFVSIVYSN